MKGSSRRRRAREMALAVLYAIDLNPTTPEEALRRHALAFGDGELDSEGMGFVLELVQGSCEHRDELDRLISMASRNWRLSRMAAVDRSLLRMAAFELLHRPDIPSRATLNEAVELAKRFGSLESRAFINGVLDRVAALVPAPDADSA